MADPAKANPKPEPKKYYFKIIPKEEYQAFYDRLKAALEKTDNKKGDKKTFEFEVRGSKEDLDGLSLEIFSFDKSKYAEFLDENEEHLKSALYCASLNLEVKEEADVAKLQAAFQQLQLIINGIPMIQSKKLEIKLRNKGKKVSFDVVAKEGKLIEGLLNLGIDLAEYHKFNFALKSGINLAEIFDPTADQVACIAKICSVIFSIKSETDNVKYLTGALVEALKDVKLDDPKIQEKYNKCVGFVNFISSYVGFKCKLEYDAKVLAGEGAKEAEKAVGGADGLKQQIGNMRQTAMGFIQGMFIPMMMQFGIIDTIKGINLDAISISLGVPKHKNGYAISLKFPGLTKLVETVLNSPPQMPPQQPKK